MIKSSKYILIFSLFFSFNAFCINISVINIDELINTYEGYIDVINRINIEQEEYSKKLKNYELELKKMLEEIENSKIIINEKELNLMINNYNTELENFNYSLDLFNLHYKDQIIKIRKLVLKEIIVLLEKYAKNNNTDLILDSTSYIIASNAINITSIVKKELNEIIIKLEFESFDKN